MLRKTAALFLSFMTIGFSSYGSQSDFITYDWLGEQAAASSYTDHIPHWRRLFNTIKVRGMLECGCGYSTAYFLNNATRVISVEYVNPGYGDQWYQVCLSLFADKSNWVPMIYNGNFRSNSFNNACAYQCATHKDYALIDDSYLKELDRHFKEQIQNSQDIGCPIDVAFVDPGIYIRGDLVKLLLANDVPIVAAHDTIIDHGTAEEENLYGWNKVITPSNYMKIYIPSNNGTTFWVNEKFPAVIVSLLAYRDKIVQLKEEKGILNWDDLTSAADMPYFLP